MVGDSTLAIDSAYTWWIPWAVGIAVGCFFLVLCAAQKTTEVKFSSTSSALKVCRSQQPDRPSALRPNKGFADLSLTALLPLLGRLFYVFAGRLLKEFPAVPNTRSTGFYFRILSTSSIP
jgi:hypothetical protein